MMIKTMNKGYVNLAKYSDFAIHHKQEGFTVIAMKPVVCYATESKRYTSAASVELGCYPSETEAQKALEAIMEHWDAIKEALSITEQKITSDTFLMSSQCQMREVDPEWENVL